MKVVDSAAISMAQYSVKRLELFIWSQRDKKGEEFSSLFQVKMHVRTFCLNRGWNVFIEGIKL